MWKFHVEKWLSCRFNLSPVVMSCSLTLTTGPWLFCLTLKHISVWCSDGRWPLTYSAAWGRKKMTLVYGWGSDPTFRHPDTGWLAAAVLCPSPPAADWLMVFPHVQPQLTLHLKAYFMLQEFKHTPLPIWTRRRGAGVKFISPNKHANVYQCVP